jgi:hypothetical protein
MLKRIAVFLIAVAAVFAFSFPALAQQGSSNGRPFQDVSSGGGGLGSIINADGDKVATAFPSGGNNTSVYAGIVVGNGEAALVRFASEGVNGTSNYLFYDSEDCTGTPYIQGYYLTNTVISDGNVYGQGDAIPEIKKVGSYLFVKGGCRTYPYPRNVVPAVLIGTLADLGLDRTPFRLELAQ